MDNKTTLVIFDAQTTYADTLGKRYIKSSEKMINNIVDYINNNADSIDKVILAKSYFFDENERGIDKRIIKALYKNVSNYRELIHYEINPNEFEYSEIIDGFPVIKTATDSCKIVSNNIVVCGVCNSEFMNFIVNVARVMGQKNVHILIDGVARIHESSDLFSLLEELDDLIII